MISIHRTRAEERFAAIERTKKVTLSERLEESAKLAAKIARLKALRLARDAVKKA